MENFIKNINPDDFVFILQNITTPMIFIIFIGYFLASKGFLQNEKTNSLYSITYILFLPILIFTVIVKSTVHLSVITWFLAISFGIVLIVLGLSSNVISHFLKNKPNDFYLNSMGASSSNVAYLGIPIIYISFGDVALLPAILFTFVMIFLSNVYVYTVLFIKNKKSNVYTNLLNVVIYTIKSPVIISVIAGFAFNILSNIFVIKFPKSIEIPLFLIGNAYIPLALLYVGVMFFYLKSNIAKFSFPKINSFLIILSKVMAVPLFAWYLSLFFEMDNVWRASIVVMSAMPTSFSVYLLSQKENYKGDEIMKIVLFSSFVSFLTIPFFIFIFI